MPSQRRSAGYCNEDPDLDPDLTAKRAKVFNDLISPGIRGPTRAMTKTDDLDTLELDELYRTRDLANLFGYMDFGKFYRWLILFTLCTFEVYAVT